MIFINIFHYIDIQALSKKIKCKNECNFLNIKSFYDLFNFNDTNKNTVLIFEPCLYHYECTPGFSKYFIELGFNVDIIMHNSGLTSFCFFHPIDKIRLFIYNEIEEIRNYSKQLSQILINYNYALMETAYPSLFKLYKELNLLNINHSFFVFHHLNFLTYTSGIKLKKNQIWSLGNFTSGIQVNPHYFGDLKIKQKNKITKFFITSTIERNYKHLILAVEKIKDENLEFHVIVVGKWNSFTYHNISDKVKDNFTFKYNISYLELYNEVIDCDYIIINLDPDNEKDEEFKSNRVTGSAQLAYGFVKPVIINNDFAKFYSFNHNNSFIFENENFANVMRNAIKQKKNQYRKMQENLLKSSNNIFQKSLYNVKKCLHLK